MRSVDRVALPFAAVLLVAAAGGCPNARSGQDGGKPDKRDVADDFQSALAWANALVVCLAEADQTGNDVVGAEARKDVDAKLAGLVGRGVRWRVPVARVTPEYVLFPQFRLRKGSTQWFVVAEDGCGDGNGGRPVLGEFAVSAFNKGRSPVESGTDQDGAAPPLDGLRLLIEEDQSRRSFLDGRRTNSLPIGNGIAFEQARKLTTGSHVTLQGTVYYCVRGYESKRGRLVAVCIKDVCVVD